MRARLHWRSVIVALIAGYGLLILGAVVFVYHGYFDIAADIPHWPAIHSIMETARMRAIKAHAHGIEAPPGLDDPAKIQMGVEHFSMHCAVCHGGPGVPKGDIAEGLYPQPPDLAVTAKLYSDAELFWIIKHGLKMTGMPSWSAHSDEELWATVALLKRLPGMTEQQYGELVKANMMHGMMHHPGGGQAMPGIGDAQPMEHGALPPKPGAPDAHEHR